MCGSGCRGHQAPRRGGQFLSDGNRRTTREAHLQQILPAAGGACEATVIEHLDRTQQRGLAGDQHIDALDERQPLGGDVARHGDVQPVMGQRHRRRFGARKTRAATLDKRGDAAGIGHGKVAQTHRLTHPQVTVVMQSHGPTRQQRSAVAPHGRDVGHGGVPCVAQQGGKARDIGTGQRGVPLLIGFGKGVGGQFNRHA